MTLAVFVCFVVLYLLIGVWVGWRRVKAFFAWGRRNGVHVDQIRSQAPSEFALWMLFWSIQVSVLVLSEAYRGLLDKAEKDSFTRSEQIAHLEEEIRKED